jgi:hypothetical protein
MAKRDALHQRSTLAYTLISLFVALTASVIFTPIGNHIEHSIERTRVTEPGQRVTANPFASANLKRPDLTQHQPRAPLDTVSPNNKTAVVTEKEHKAPRREVLAQQCDSFVGRFKAVETSLRERSRDFAGFPIKPEIAAAIETTKLDLAAAEEALSHDDIDNASLRLKRVGETLRYLESL